LFRKGFNYFGHKDTTGVNYKIIKALKDIPIDILWIDKGLTIKAETLRWVKRNVQNCIILGYSPDDMFSRHNQSREFLTGLKDYDLFVTTKSYGVEELKSLGAKRVLFVGNSFDSRGNSWVRRLEGHFDRPTISDPGCVGPRRQSIGQQ